MAPTNLWFHLKMTATRRKALVLDDLKKLLGAGVRAIPDGAWLYLATSQQAADAIDLAALDADSARLPELLAVADRWLAERWPG